jgi:lysophospholipase L1-like esterase
MNQRKFWSLAIPALFAMGVMSYGLQQPVRPIGFADTIQQFLDQDKTSPPPQDAILFIGSSIFRQWADLRKQMAPLPVFNRAFGGSRTWEVLHYMDKIVLPYKPRIIVYYCGSNDVDFGAPAPEIFANFRAFVDKVSSRLPETRIFYVSINKAPEKKARWNVVDEANSLIRNYTAHNNKLGFIDVNPVLFDAAGNPRLELYRDDLLHFHPPAYVEFTKIIRPVIEKAWNASH